MPTFTTTIATPPASDYVGRYCELADLVAVRGQVNVNRWSTKEESDVLPSIGAVRMAIQSAEAEVDEQVGRRFTLPLSWTDANETVDRQRLREIAESIAAFNLYRARGLADDDQTAAKLSAEADAARARLQAIGDGAVAFFAERPTSTSVRRAPFVVP